MFRSLVTGASGFIGSHLTEALVRRGDHVRCLVRPSSDVGELERLGVDLFRADLTRPDRLDEAAAGVEVVYHAAGRISSVPRAELMRVNGEGTRRLAAACAAQNRPPVFLLISSIAAAGPCRRDELRKESDPPAPVSWYGESKLAGERAVERFADRMPVTVVRPGIVFGPRDRESFLIFATVKRFRCHATPGFRSPPLSLIHVEDLVEVAIRAAERGERVDPQGGRDGRPGGAYFACSPEHPTYAELGWMISRALGRRLMIPLPCPPPIPWAAAAFNELLNRVRRRPNTFTIDKIREARAASWACSPDAVFRDLDFQPPKPLQVRLHETAQWYFEHQWL